MKMYTIIIISSNTSILHTKRRIRRIPQTLIGNITQIRRHRLLTMYSRLTIFRKLRRQNSILSRVKSTTQQRFSTRFHRTTIRQRARKRPRQRTNSKRRPHHLNYTNSASKVDRSTSFLRRIRLPTLQSTNTLIILLPRRRIGHTNHTRNELPKGRTYNSTASAIHKTIAIINHNRIVQVFIMHRSRHSSVFTRTPRPTMYKTYTQ